MIELSSTDNADYLKMHRRDLKGDAKWKDVEDLINRWAKRNPAGALMTDRYIKEVRGGLKDKKFGLMEGKSKGGVNAPGTRIGVALHPELLQYLEAFYPDIFKTKSGLHEFKKRFPKFRVPEAV
jgi:hypothetical protein